MSGQGILVKLDVSVRRGGLPGFIWACYLRAVFLFGARTGENICGLCLYLLSCSGMLWIVARLGGCFDIREKCWSVTRSLV